MATERQSNIELLRIVAIIGVICHHILVHGLKIYNIPVDNYPWAYSLLNNLCYVGVNVFLLISGYFSIKFSWKKLLQLYLMCFFVGSLCYIWHCIDSDMSIGRTLLYHNSIFAFSHHSLWYVLPYICLFILSPFINKLLSSLEKKSFNYLLLVLIVISCYYGWFWQNQINSNGYCLMQFITMYSIGYYLSQYNVVDKVRSVVWGGYLCCSQ